MTYYYTIKLNLPQKIDNEDKFSNYWMGKLRHLGLNKNV